MSLCSYGAGKVILNGIVGVGRSGDIKSLTLRLLMSYIYGAPILDVSRSHTRIGRTPLDE